VVVDVGTNVLPDGSLTGDVDEASVRGTAAALTPVPGGVGSVTTALLLLHTLEAARLQSTSAGSGAESPASAILEVAG
jgi:methylenetetrahydrofolate dehydrogenase (NADP+)/methenyltetrahydrofolate cyclohydrolase